MKKVREETIYGYLKGTVNLTCEAEAQVMSYEKMSSILYQNLQFFFLQPAAEFMWYRNNKRLVPRSHPIFNGPHFSYLQVRNFEVLMEV